MLPTSTKVQSCPSEPLPTSKVTPVARPAARTCLRVSGRSRMFSSSASTLDR
jgi:hypothetical protein